MSLKQPHSLRFTQPDNIMVGLECTAKLADFGESKHFDPKQARAEADFDGEDALTMTAVGSKLYMAPEITMNLRYNESVDTRVYSNTSEYRAHTISAWHTPH